MNRGRIIGAFGDRREFAAANSRVFDLVEVDRRFAPGIGSASLVEVEAPRSRARGFGPDVFRSDRAEISILRSKITATPGRSARARR